MPPTRPTVVKTTRPKLVTRLSSTRKPDYDYDIEWPYDDDGDETRGEYDDDVDSDADFDADIIISVSVSGGLAFVISVVVAVVVRYLKYRSSIQLQESQAVDLIQMRSILPADISAPINPTVPADVSEISYLLPVITRPVAERESSFTSSRLNDSIISPPRASTPEQENIYEDVSLDSFSTINSENDTTLTEVKARLYENVTINERPSPPATPTPMMDDAPDLSSIHPNSEHDVTGDGMPELRREETGDGAIPKRPMQLRSGKQV